MKQFTSTATKDGRWWVVQCDQEPGALSQVARLDQAEAHQREAISMITDLAEAEIEVVINPELDQALPMGIGIAHLRREEADRLQREASELVTAIAQTMVEEGFSLRDIGFVLGVSHQRVAQLVAAKPPTQNPLEVVTQFAHGSIVGFDASNFALGSATRIYHPGQGMVPFDPQDDDHPTTQGGEEVILMGKGDVDTYYEDGQWKNKVEGGQRATSTHATKAEAEKAGRDMARAREVEHVIKKKDGTIGEKNSYGNDPRNVKG